LKQRRETHETFISLLSSRLTLEQKLGEPLEWLRGVLQIRSSLFAGLAAW